MINKTIDKLTIAILAAAALAMPLHAAEKKTETAPAEKTAAAAPAKSASADAENTTGFRGTIASVDKEKKTITIANKKGTTSRTFTVGDTAKLMKGKKDTATWSDLTVGETVHGTFQKSADGKMEVVTLKVGAAGKAKAAKSEAGTTEAKPVETKKP